VGDSLGTQIGISLGIPICTSLGVVVRFVTVVGVPIDTVESEAVGDNDVGLIVGTSVGALLGDVLDFFLLVFFAFWRSLS